MNRTEALSYIRTNSRCMAQYSVGRYDDDENDETQNRFLEQRLSNSDVPFILHDMGTLGWDVYFLSNSGNSIQGTVDEFNQKCLRKETA